MIPQWMSLCVWWVAPHQHFKEKSVSLVTVTPICCVFLQDGNGYIDEQELDALLRDLCDKNKMVMNSEPIDSLVRVTFQSPNIELRWINLAYTTSAFVPFCITSSVIHHLFYFRVWIWKSWRDTRKASWLCQMKGNCTGLRWRSSSAGTPHCDLLNCNLVHVTPNLAIAWKVLPEALSVPLAILAL